MGDDFVLPFFFFLLRFLPVSFVHHTNKQYAVSLTHMYVRTPARSPTRRWWWWRRTRRGTSTWRTSRPRPRSTRHVHLSLSVYLCVCVVCEREKNCVYVWCVRVRKREEKKLALLVCQFRNRPACAPPNVIGPPILPPLPPLPPPTTNDNDNDRTIWRR